MIIFFVSKNGHALNIYLVGEEITGKEYNNILKGWFEKNFGIWVGVDERNTEYIIFQCETNLGKAKVLVYNSKKTIEKLKNAILKAIEWSDVAKKNSADGTKSLGCFGQDKWDLCEKEGTTFDKNQMGLRFFATNKGKQTNLIISLVDRDNQFIKTSIYLDLQKNEQLAQRS